MPIITPPQGPPGPTFNGGTITTPLIVANPANNALPITVDVPAGMTEDALAVKDELGTRRIELFTGDSTSKNSSLTLNDPIDGGIVNISSENGLQVAVDTGGGTNPAVTIRGPLAAGATGDALQIKSAGGVVMGGFLIGGAFYTQLHAAPADAALAAGQVALWFDETNGAAKLMVKGKSADGTVVTGSLALS